MIVLAPLADNEKRRVETKHKVIELQTSQCEYPFNHIFFFEVGKLLHFWKNNKEDFDSICFIQNRKFFKDLDNFPKIDDNIVYLAPLIKVQQKNIIENFKKCKCNNFGGYEIFNKIITKSKLNKKLLNSKFFSPHNIFYSNKLFFNQYCQFLNDYLISEFDDKINVKNGAWICERLLHLFAHSFFKVEEKEMIILNKI